MGTTGSSQMTFWGTVTVPVVKARGHLSKTRLQFGVAWENPVMQRPANSPIFKDI